MRPLSLLVTVWTYLLPFWALGQGSLIYDQQTSTDETPWPFGAGGTIQQIPAPWGQSFTPRLSAVDFIKLQLNDGSVGDGQGATVSVNLRSDSVTGSILSSSLPVTMPNGFRGPVLFQFPSTVPVTAGTLYYFDVVQQSGKAWNIAASESNYFDGEIFVRGIPDVMSDLWFREGIIVPEPSSALVAVLGFAALSLRNLVRRRCT